MCDSNGRYCKFAFYKIWFHCFLLSAGGMWVQLSVASFSVFFSLLFGFYFEWGLSKKLINIIVQSHLFSRAELPAEIQTGRKDTDGLLRIPGVCLPLEQRACVRARPWPHEGRSLRHHWGSFHPKHPSKGFIYLQLKDEPFNPFL